MSGEVGSVEKERGVEIQCAGRVCVLFPLVQSSQFRYSILEPSLCARPLSE